MENLGIGSVTPNFNFESTQNKKTGANRWNEAWNNGFNSADSKNNPFSGQVVDGYDLGAGFTQGQQAYFKQKGVGGDPKGDQKILNPPSQNNSSSNGTPAVDMKFYQGWTDQNAINADWAKTWQEKIGQGGSGGSDDALKAWEEKQKSTINSGYDEYEKRLHGMEETLNKSQDENIASTEDTYSKVFSGLDEQKKANLDKLNVGREGVTQRKLTSLDELKKNLADVVRGTSMEMGALGAGDTSAAKMMVPYAYTKIAGDQGATIEKQANQQYFDIDQEERDTDLKFTELWKETEIEKGNKLQEVKNIFGEKLQNISFALASAPLDKEKDLLALQDQILKQAYTRLVQLETETKQKQDDLKTWATNRLVGLNDAKLKLKNTANFNPEDILFSELKMANSPQVVADNGYNWNPMALAKKVREEFFA